DSSWAMRWNEFEPDLAWVAARPGKKLFVRGNHDYWWPSIQRLRQLLPPGTMALQNDHLCYEDVVVVGTRGWVCPGSRGFKPEEDQKIYDREVGRLRMSLDSAPRGRPLVCALHYPPTNERLEPSAFTELLRSYDVKVCVYGHLHGDRAVKSSL